LQLIQIKIINQQIIKVFKIKNIRIEIANLFLTWLDKPTSTSQIPNCTWVLYFFTSSSSKSTTVIWWIHTKIFTPIEDISSPRFFCHLKICTLKDFPLVTKPHQCQEFYHNSQRITRMILFTVKKKQKKTIEACISITHLISLRILESVYV
jgi:hypothetical protein